jgi:hypothetical protein
MPTWIRLGTAALTALGSAATGGCGGAKPAPAAAGAAPAPSASPTDTAGLLRVRFARGTTSARSRGR